jgi:hypothetical protein
LIEPQASRMARVTRVIEAGRRLASPADALGILARRRLVETSRLSPEGVALALGEHLETDPDPRDLAALIAGCGSAPRCHVVLSANVCTGALRAIALATATSPAILARPSRRDPVVLELVATALQQDEEFAGSGGSIEIVSDARPSSGDELHLYGSDETIGAIVAHTAPGVVIRAHGTGFGVAVVGTGAGITHSAAAIAGDVVPFDQRGCLSPRVVLVEGDGERADSLAEALHKALCALGDRIPRGPLDESAGAEMTRYRATIESIGQWRQGPDHAIGLDPEPRALMLPPPLRVVHVMPMSSYAAAAPIGPWVEWIAAIGTDDAGALSDHVIRTAPGARLSRLGAMQKPPLDGPVDRRQRRFGEPLK